MSHPLRYGEREYFLESETDLLKPKPHHQPIITSDDVVAALDDPVGGCSLADGVAGAENVTIIVSDITRYTGAEIFLPPLLDRLNISGVEDAAITILFATGTHRGHTDTERTALVGEEVVYRDVRLIDHDADGADCVASGIVIAGEEIRLNRYALECDRLVLTGSTLHHYLAGFGGGRKGIMPGVASRADAQRFHYLSLNPHGAGRHPCVGPGILHGNPMHEFATAVMRKRSPCFLLNTVLNNSGKVVAVMAGEPETTWEKGVAMSRSIAEVTVGVRADVVVASCGGYPKDINFVQAHKTYDNAVRALKPGGTLFLLAECRDGAGSPTFLPWFEKGTAEGMGKALRPIKNFQINGQTAMATGIKAETYRTHLLSSLPAEMVRTMGITPYNDPDVFMMAAASALQKSTTSYVMPDGAYTVPMVR